MYLICPSQLMGLYQRTRLGRCHFFFTPPEKKRPFYSWPFFLKFSKFSFIFWKLNFSKIIFVFSRFTHPSYYKSYLENVGGLFYKTFVFEKTSFLYWRKWPTHPCKSMPSHGLKGRNAHSRKKFCWIEMHIEICWKAWIDTQVCGLPGKHEAAVREGGLLRKRNISLNAERAKDLLLGSVKDRRRPPSCP